HVVKARQISRERVLRSNRFADAIRENRTMINTSADPVEMPSRLPEMLQQEGFVLCPEIERGEDPELLHPCGCRWPDAVKPLHRERLDKIRPHRRRDDEETIRLAIVRGYLGEELVVRNTRGCCQLGLSADFCSDLFGDLCRGCDVLQIFSHIEISFVE